MTKREQRREMDVAVGFVGNAAELLAEAQADVRDRLSMRRRWARLEAKRAAVGRLRRRFAD